MKSLSPEEKRAMLARLLKQQPAVCKTAFILQGLILDSLLYGQPIWNMRSTLRFFRKVEPELLRSRLQRVIDRHPALRTTYELPAGRELEFEGKMLCVRLDAMKLWEVNLEAMIEQRVHPQHTLEMRVVDARGWSAERLREQLMADALQPYDLRSLPICRLRLYQREHDDVMQFDVHHCAADLWSLELIMAELEVPKEAPPPPSFAEFCTWQHAWFALPKAQEMRKWWARELAGCPDLALPHSTGDDPAEFITFRVDAETTAAARQICRSHKVTLFNLMLSTLQVTAWRALEIDDFTIGGAVANRPHQRFEDTVGFFAQLVLYRRDLNDVESWAELWARNRTTISDVLDHQTYPVTTTMAHPRTDLWIMFQQYKKARWLPDHPPGDDLGLRSGGVVDSPLGPWEFLFVEPPFHSSPVMLEIIEQNESLQGLLRFRVTALGRKKARALVGDFQALLKASLANPGAFIGARI